MFPTLSRHVVKNGDVVSLTVLAKAAAGIRSVSADMGGIEKITLMPATNTVGMPADGSISLWSGEWTGRGLQERIYKVTIEVTDSSGHTLRDSSLEFTDPVAGVTDVGTTVPPSLGFGVEQTLQLEPGETNLSCAVADLANGYAYFGTNTMPGKIIKVALGDAQTSTVRVAALTLPAGEGNLKCAVIDPASGFAWFGTAGDPARVIKVSLGTGNAAPSRVGAITLLPGEQNLACAAIDAASGYAYFGGNSYPASVIKVALGAGNGLPSRVSALNFDTSEGHGFRSMVLDPLGGYAYVVGGFGKCHTLALEAGDTTPTLTGTVDSGTFGQGGVALNPQERMLYFGEGSYQSHGVVKMRLGSPGSLPSRVYNPFWSESSPDAYKPASLVVDPGTGFAYLGLRNNGIAKARLGESATPVEPVGITYADPQTTNLASAIIDPDRGLAWFGSDSDTGRIVVVRIATDPVVPHVLGTASLGTRDDKEMSCVLVDPSLEFAVVGTGGKVAKVSLGSGSEAPRVLSELHLYPGDFVISCGALDPVNRYAYFGMSSSNPATRVVKVRLGHGDEPPVRVDDMWLGGASSLVHTALINVAAGHVYFGTNSGAVEKVAVGGGDTTMRLIGTLFITGFPNQLVTGVIDAAAGYAYYGTANGAATTPGRCVKVRLGRGDELPTEAGACSLNAGEFGIQCTDINTSSGHVYFGTNTSPPKVIKVATNGDGVPSRVEALSLPNTDPGLRAGRVDGLNACAYFACGSTTHTKVIKVSLGDSTTTMSRLGALTMPGYASVDSMGADLPNGYAYLGSRQSSTGALIKVSLNGALPAFVGAMPMGTAHDGAIGCGIIDAVNGYAYLGTRSATGSIVKVALGNDGTSLTRVASLVLAPGEGALKSAILDPTNTYAYFGTDTKPAKVIKVALTSGTLAPRRVGAATFALDQKGAFAPVVDWSRGQALYASETTDFPVRGYIVKVDLGAGENPPSMLSSYKYPFGSGNITCGDFDPLESRAYFATNNPDAPVFKVDFGAGATAPAILNTTFLNYGDGSAATFVIDPLTRFAYLSKIYDSYGPLRITKVALSSGANPVQRIGATFMPDDYMVSVTRDPSTGYLYYAARDAGTIVAVDPGEGSELPQRIGAVTLPASPLAVLGTDSARGHIYAGSDTTPGHLLKVGTRHEDFIKATRISFPERARVNQMRFYSHAGGGSIRLGIYNDRSSRSLLWSHETSVPVANTWVDVPVNAGSPSTLELPAGSYWLAWQSDMPAPVGSYLPGASATGFYLSHPRHSAFPAAIHKGEEKLTGDQWSSYITYDDISPNLGINATPLDYGSLDVDDGFSASQSVTLTNTGIGPLHFEGAGFSITGTHAADFSFATAPVISPVPVGENRIVSVRFNPTATGPRNAQLVITTEDYDQPVVTIPLSGTGLDQEIEIGSGTISFGDWAVTSGASPTVSVPISNTGSAPLNFTGSGISLAGELASHFTITNSPSLAPLAPGTTRTVEVAFDPDTHGGKSARIRIETDDTDEPVVEREFQGNGLAPDVYLAGPVGGTLTYGSQDVDEGPSASKRVTIGNNGNQNLALSSVLLTGPDAADFSFVAAPSTAPLVPSGTRFFSIVFDPATSGSKSAKLQVTSSDHDEPVLEVNLAGTATGDQDGLSQTVENGAPNGGDGNLDGIADAEQPHVASLPNRVDGRYLTLEAAPGTYFLNVRTVANPSPGDAPAGVTFPLGFVAFTLAGIPAGGDAVVSLIHPADVPVGTFMRHGPTPDNTTAHWYAAGFDGVTGAIPATGRMTLHFRDGLRGDDDLAANGQIVDPGAPAVTTSAIPDWQLY